MATADPARLNCLYIDVEVYGGCDIPTAIGQMVQLANRTGLSIWATMNGVRTLACPGDDAMLITEAWSYALTHRQSHASAPRSLGAVERKSEATNGK